MITTETEERVGTLSVLDLQAMEVPQDVQDGRLEMGPDSTLSLLVC